jgi:predicted NBD/HSP70 family sugar kinase
MENGRSAARTTVRKVDGRLMQQANRAMVLNLVRSDPTLSRAAIVRRTGLSPAAVSTIVDHLLRENLVREEGAVVTGSVGRRPQRLAFNPDARLALGIDLDVREVSAALVDLGGTTHAVYREAVPEALDPPAVLDLAASVARHAAEDAPPSMLLGVGMAVPGMVTWPGGVNLFSPNFGWRDVPVRAMMEARLGRPVLVDNEVRVLAQAEHAFGAARDAETVVFLDAGYGLGGAVIIDGTLYRGRHGAAAEFGHNTVEQGGPRCACGNQGCLEVFASVSGLRARVREALAAGHTSVLASAPGDTLSVERIAEAAQAGDALAGEVLARAATYLGLAVANVVDSWDPELVVLSGPVIAAGDVLFEDLLATEQRSVLETGRNRVRVARAAIQAHAKIIGAATLVIADYLAAPLLAR